MIALGVKCPYINFLGVRMIINNINSHSILSSSSEETSNTKTTTSSFAQALEETNKSPQETSAKSDEQLQMEEDRKILEDIFSLMQTGLTKSELEALEKLMQKIKESMKKEDANEEEIKELLQALEDMMLQFQKRLSGEMLKEKDDSNTAYEEAVPSSIASIVSKLEELSKTNEEFKTYNRLVRQHEELELLESLKEAV
jgi:hypothetical protein